MLVGREVEQAATDRLVVGARVGQGGALVLTGEGGIGKTALLEHAAAGARGMRVLRAVGTRSERDVPFGGLLQLLRPTLDVLGRIPPPQGEALAVALALRPGEPGDRFAIGAATLSLLSRCGEDGPLLLLIDDTHTLDLPSLEVVVFVARRLTTDPIAILAASRATPDLPDLLTALPRLDLDGLDEAAASRLLSGQPGPRVDDAVVRRLHRATAGNPLALLELGGDPAALDRISPAAPLPVPQVVADSFRRRAGLLSPSARTALVVAAVADDDLPLVSAATRSLGGDVADLVEAESAGLVDLTPGHVRFRHPLARSSAYRSAPADLRRRAHTAVALHLPDDDLERRTWHLSEAALGPDASLADDLDRVGGRARRRSAYSVAATAHERSALLSPDRPARASRLFAAGEAAWLAGQPHRAEELLIRSAGLAHDRPSLAAIDGLRGAIASRTGSLEKAHLMLTDAAEGLRETDPRAAVRLLSEAVNTCVWRADAAGAEQSASLMEAIDPALLDAHTRLLVDLGTGISRVLGGRDGIGRIRRAVDQLSVLDPWSDDPRRPVSSLVGVLFLRETGPGRDLLARIEAGLRERAALAMLPETLLFVARVEASADRWQQGISHFEECIELAEEAGHATVLAVARSWLASLHARMGQEAECREQAETGLDLAARHHVHLARIWATFALGDLELGLGRPARALGHYEALVGILAEIGLDDVDVVPGPELVECLLRTGRPDEARRTARRFHAHAVGKGQPWACARAERALGTVAEHPEADHHFTAALELHALTPDRYEEARTRLAHASALRRQRRRVDARPLLRSAVSAFEQIGATPWAEAAAAELSATGETPARRGEDAWVRLTPQERQISRMLADGRTTKQAAAALFLSPKTVEYHLRHVYTKLDIHSRDELSATLAGPADDESG